MAHSYILAFATEYEAFSAFANTYPDNCILLVDTYSTLQSGIPNAIRLASEVLHPRGKRLKAVRIDSGDLAYLSQEARKVLMMQGFLTVRLLFPIRLRIFDCQSFSTRGKIDAFGVGEQLITSRTILCFMEFTRWSVMQNGLNEN